MGPMSAPHIPHSEAKPQADATPQDHAERIVKRSGSSFFSGMRVLPRPQREAMYAVYAFCREVDDIADEPGEQEEKRVRLQAWRDEIERLFEGRPLDAIAAALAGPVERYGLRKEDFLALIDGMEMDAGDTVRLRDADELALYCDRVACAVGRLSVRVFGVDPGCGDEAAGALGQALQLTNILRDLKEDADRDRLYLPADMLAARGIEATAIEGVLEHPALPAVCDELARTTAERYAEAEAAIARCGLRRMRPAVVMMEVYRRVFDRLRRRGWRRLDQPVSVSKLEKLWIAFRHGIL